jgi:hypothetical protein
MTSFSSISFLRITNDYNNPSLYAEKQYPLRKDEEKRNRKRIHSSLLEKGLSSAFLHSRIKKISRFVKVKNCHNKNNLILDI